MQRQAQRGDACVMMEGEPTSQGTPGSLANARGWEKGMDPALPQSLRREPILPTPWFETSGLQDCERNMSVVLRHPVGSD